jgi:hypothetical protein
VDLPPVWREHCESFVIDNIRASDGALVVLDLAGPDPVRDFQETVAFLREKHIVLVPLRRGEPPARTPGNVEYEVVLNKADLDPSGEMVTLVRQMLDTSTPLRAVSARKGDGLEELRADLFDLLHVIRVYSKEHGREPDLTAPFTVPIGATVMDFAAHVHHDFAARLKSARVWGSAKFDGQSVHRDHVLQDRDIVELSMS